MLITQIDEDRIIEDDIFNYTHLHSFYSDSEDDYNCFGYAFNIFDWLIPIDFHIEDYYEIVEELGLSIDEAKKYSIDNAFQNSNFSNEFIRYLCVKRILDAFPEVRIVDSFDELNSDEYGIAFATGKDDFHFVKYDNGIYSHKRGSIEIEKLSCEADGFGIKYSSPVTRFAMKKGEIKFNDDFISYEV